MTVGLRVIVQAGWGGHGGMAGQDFRRFAVDTPAVVTDVAGSNVYVKPDDSPYKWRVPARALQLA
jgi:hypothetical protein